MSLPRPGKPSSNSRLHDSVNRVYLFQENFLAPGESKTISEALDNITAALEDGADINSPRNFNPAELTLLQRALLCVHKIAGVSDLSKIIKFLIQKKADVTKQPLLDLILPKIDSAKQYTGPDISIYIYFMELLFEAGAYQINKSNALEVSKHLASVEFNAVISKIIFVNDVRDKIIKPLIIEHNRLNTKYKQDWRHNSIREDILSTTITALNAALQQFHQDSKDTKSRARCEGNIANALQMYLVTQSPFLEKYSDLQKLGRSLCNVLLTIATGVLPGLALYAITAHSFLSTIGKTKSAAQTSCDNAGAMLGTQFILR